MLLEGRMGQESRDKYVLMVKHGKHRISTGSGQALNMTTSINVQVAVDALENILASLHGIHGLHVHICVLYRVDL